MKTFRLMLAAGILSAAIGSIAASRDSRADSRPAPVGANPAGVHSFDFLVGEWRVRRVNS